jgi:phosphoenolpyruvate phosphomutase
VNPSTHDKFNNVDGEFIGLWKVSESRVQTVLRLMSLWNEEGVLKQRSIPDLLNHLAKDEKINVKYIRGSWMDVDTIVDLQKAGML